MPDPEIRLRIRSDEAQAIAGMQRVNTSLGKLGKGITKLRTNWLGITAGATAFFFALRKYINVFASFEQKMAEVGTLVDTAAVNMDKLSNSVISLSTQMPQSADELASALYQVVSAGVDAGQAMGVLELSAKAAVAGVTDVKVAADVGTTILNAYGKSVEDLSGVFDVLFTGVKLGKTTFTELGASLGRVVTLAATAKIKFETVIGALTQMTKVGIRTEEAVVALRQGIISLTAPTEIARKSMAEMGIEYTNFVDTVG